MDAIDATIVDLLQVDARTTQADIARRVRLSQPSVAERIRKLEEARIITGYTARVDPRKLGKDITAFISVDVGHPKHFDSFARKVMEMPEVLECHRVAGKESYVLKVRTANAGSLDRLLVEELRTAPGVTRTQTTIVLASVKEDTRVVPSVPGPAAARRTSSASSAASSSSNAATPSAATPTAPGVRR